MLLEEGGQKDSALNTMTLVFKPGDFGTRQHDAREMCKQNVCGGLYSVLLL